jgi:hypothetical protein
MATCPHGAQELAVALDMDHQPRAVHDRRALGRQQLRQDADGSGLGRFVVVQMLAVLVRVHGLGLDVKAVERHRALNREASASVASEFDRGLNTGRARPRTSASHP